MGDKRCLASIILMFPLLHKSIGLIVYYFMNLKERGVKTNSIKPYEGLILKKIA